MSRRQILSYWVASTAVIGVLLGFYPFAVSLKPNKTSSPVFDIDVVTAPAGERQMFIWRGKPAVFYKPDKASIAYLISLNDKTTSVPYTRESIPDFFIYVPLSDYGCLLHDTGRPEYQSIEFAGYMDVCRYGYWDHSGRYISRIDGFGGFGDLEKISDYQWISDTVIRIPAQRIPTGETPYSAKPRAFP